MDAFIIVSNLNRYTLLLDEIVAMMNTETSPGPSFERSVTSVSNQVKLDLYTGPMRHLYLRVVLNIQSSGVTLVSAYCERPDMQLLVAALISERLQQGTLAWSDLPADGFSSEVTEALDLADAIAQVTDGCAKGDHYRPGRFSEVVLKEKSILLLQVNRMNARSIDHKDDYIMRDLHFVIPLDGATPRFTHRIGLLYIRFSDRSSPQNKACGDALEKKLTGLKGLVRGRRF